MRLALSVAAALLSSCAHWTPPPPDQAWADNLNRQTWNQVQHVNPATVPRQQVSDEEMALIRAFVAQHPCQTDAPGPLREWECPGKRLALIIPAPCGGAMTIENMAWMGPEEEHQMMRMAAQCVMQAQAMQQQAVAAGSIQQQMQNALLYNDLTRIMGSGFYQWSPP